ncbi:MAG: hypothetical protein PHV32_09705 [Eubacteriales bacterium]|nr:hypothetical protein [Eubacteriales bacterium]
MIKLTHENFIKARDYIFANPDDINRAWFRYNFEDGDIKKKPAHTSSQGG